MAKELHIISLEMPYPPDYGGVIGIFNRIKALHQSGLKIHLHVFYYDRLPNEELKNFCSTLHYYKRDMRKTLLFSKLPFIVASRSSRKLLDNLLKVDAPILFEGLHTCYFLNHPKLNGRIKLVRMHNIEHEYYHHLALAEKSKFKKWYLNREAKKLLSFENVLKNADYILPVVESDFTYLSKKFQNCKFIPVFINENDFQFSNENEKVVLYHGNLSVSENYLAVDWLIQKVFSKINHKCIIAGKKPPEFLLNAAKPFSNIHFEINPSQEKMNHFLNTSQVVVLPTFQATGIKLKLIDTLMKGKQCIVNAKMLHGTPLHHLCKVAETPSEFIEGINLLMNTPFSKEDFENRKKLLTEYFNNDRSVNQIKEMIKASTD